MKKLNYLMIIIFFFFFQHDTFKHFVDLFVIEVEKFLFLFFFQQKVGNSDDFVKMKKMIKKMSYDNF